MRVRFAECDPQGIVFNSRYLEYFDIAITELWRETVGPYQEATERMEIDLVVGEATVRYLAALRFDEEFDLLVTVARLGTTGITTAIAVERADGTRVAEGEIRHVVVRFGSAAKMPIPEELRSALEPYVTETARAR